MMCVNRFQLASWLWFE